MGRGGGGWKLEAGQEASLYITPYFNVQEGLDSRI